METAILIVGVNVAWPVLAWAAMAAAGAVMFDPGVLPQWCAGLGAVAIACTALALNVAVYLGLDDGAEPRG